MIDNQQFNKEESLDLIDSWSTANTEKDIVFLKNELAKMLLSFNVFEKIYFNKTRQHWWELFDIAFDYDEVLTNYFKFNKAYNFFKNRYMQNKSFTNNFHTLNINSERKKALKQNLKTDKNKAYTLMAISYQFRNNIYHGTKNIVDLAQYVKCYEAINEFLWVFMKNIDENVILNINN